MNTINNKRKRDSQEKIENIFLDLIQTKEISEISVTDICKIANLNRTTFYSNYIDIYDLADKIREKLESDVLHLYIDEHGYTYKNFLKLFKHIKDNQILYKTYFKLGFDKNPISSNYYHTLKNAHLYYDTDNVDYHIEFFKAGLNAIILKWLYNGCKESPEEMEEIIKLEYKKKELIIN